jgi:hypothetical protein
MTGFAKFDLPAIRDRNDLAMVAAREVPLKRRGHKQAGPCPFHVEKTGSFFIFGEGATAHYHCFGCGAHGDVIGFVMRTQDLSFVEACKMLTEQGGLDRPDVLAAASRRAAEATSRAQAEEAQRQAVQRQMSRAIWRETETAGAQTPVRRYFAGRGIELSRLPDGRLPEDIRFHPHLNYWWTPDPSEAKPNPMPRAIATLPAIVAAIRGADGAGIGVEITYLSLSGWGKAEVVDPETGEILTAKKMRGNPWGGAVRLAGTARTMGFCEGKETGLSVMCAEPGLPVWAALSIGNLAGGGLGRGRRVAIPEGLRTQVPQGSSSAKRGSRMYRYLPSAVPDPDSPAFMPPSQCVRAILLEDADNADPESADCQYACAAARWIKAGKDVSRVRPPDGLDFNDMVRPAKPTEGVHA